MASLGYARAEPDGYARAEPDGYARAEPDGPTASLCHPLRTTGSGPQCSATHRLPQDPTGSAGPERAAGAAGRGPPLKEPPAAGPVWPWAEGAEWSEGGARHGSGQADADVTKSCVLISLAGRGPDRNQPFHQHRAFEFGGNARICRLGRPEQGAGGTRATRLVVLKRKHCKPVSINVYVSLST